MDTQPAAVNLQIRNFIPMRADDGSPDQSNPPKSGYSIGDGEDHDENKAPSKSPSPEPGASIDDDDVTTRSPDQSNPPKSGYSVVQ